MLGKAGLAIAAAALLTGAAFATDEPKEECASRDLDDIATAVQKAPSCARAVAIFEVCQFGATGDVFIGQEVTKKCEADFLAKLNATQKRAYEQKQVRCSNKYRRESGSMYRSMEAFCGAYVARDYSARALKAKPAR
ncbi:MAG TPA: hypothetical protein VFB45_04540 [Pseudolabrys sp.]|nr:hypothetical protein [Pseudolabrys sp.]